MTSPRIHAGSLVCANGDIPFTRLHDDLLAIDPRTGYCYSMNPSAARIWELIHSTIGVSAVCAALCEEFGINGEQCHTDVLEFLNALADANLVKVKG
jgi:hypothetical protein